MVFCCCCCCWALFFFFFCFVFLSTWWVLEGRQYIVHNFTMVVGESFRVSRRLVYSVSARLSSGPPAGRPHARLKAGTPREAPTPAPATKTPSPQQRIGAVRWPKQHGEHQPSNYWRGGWGVGWGREGEGRTAPPLEPRVNTEIRRPTRAAKLETGTYHWLCKSMRGPRPPSGTSPGCSGETCSLSEETKAPQRQQLVPPATRHDTAEEACHTPLGRASSGGARCPLCNIVHTPPDLQPQLGARSASEDLARISHDPHFEERGGPKVGKQLSTS